MKHSSVHRINRLVASIVVSVSVIAPVWFVFDAATATAADSGFVSANRTITSNSVSTPDYGWTSNNLYATFSASADYADYGFQPLGIPSNATISGIEVSIEGKRDSTNWNQTPRNLTAAVWNASNSIPDAFTGAQTAVLSTSDSVVLLGGPSSLWGKTWTVADFADSTFKIRVSDSSASNGHDAYLDQIRVKVYYTTPTPTPTPSVTPTPTLTPTPTPSITPTPTVICISPPTA
jgi:hypothetical protein